jgi:hypothetical protein
VQSGRRNSFTAVAAPAASEVSEVSGFGKEVAKASRPLRRSTESRSSQVVRHSLEDAISRKAVGSPDWPGRL